MTCYIGLDLGGTAIKAGVIDTSAQIVTSDSIPTEADGGADHVIDRMAQVARSVAKKAGIDDVEIGGVGVGTPGPIDPKTQIVLQAPNLGWKDIALGAELQDRLRWPVTIVNDANAAAYGEFAAGIGRSAEVTDMILLTLGTGLGSGIVMNNRLFIGPHGAGAELGHCIVALNGRRCGCGQRGCIEQYASASAIANEAKRRRALGETTTLGHSPTAKDVFCAAAARDALANSVIDEACEYLGAAIVTFTHVIDPQLVVLGGGVTAAGDALLGRAREAFIKHNWKAAPHQVRIELATLGNDAGFIGAASLARDGTTQP